MTVVDTLSQNWRSRLQTDRPQQSTKTHESIVKWLLGEDLARYDSIDAKELKIAEQAMDYRYRILIQRYLGVSQQRAYQQLIQRLGSLFLIRSKVRTWVALSRDRRRSVVDVIKEVIQEMLQSDRHIQRQIQWISQCTTDTRLRNALMLTSIEEYCLRPIRNQPLLVYRFVNYLRRSQRGGMTQVPSGDLIRIVSEEIVLDDAENSVSLLDTEAISQYQDQQAWQEQQSLRSAVKTEFLEYLQENVGSEAAQWLELHLQGQTQEVIAQRMNMPIKQIYRLREKISYHAIRVFSVKAQPDMVMTWLGTSLKEHSLGLTTTQWDEFWRGLNATQRHIVERLKADESVEAIARELNLKSTQVLSEWNKVYLAAQDVRSHA